MGYFDFNIVDTLLHKLTTKHDMLVQEAGSRSSSAKLVPADVTQLYQAVAWLKQPSGSKQMEAWSNLLSRLRKLAQEPTMTKLSVPGQAELCAALAMQGVPYKAQVPCGMHWAHAVLSPHNISAADVLLMLERPEDFITNVPSRYVCAVQGYAYICCTYCCDVMQKPSWHQAAYVYGHSRLFQCSTCLPAHMLVRFVESSSMYAFHHRTV